ncbi:MAG: phosphotransferase, partial [Pseudoclavibacter sp.]
MNDQSAAPPTATEPASDRALESATELATRALPLFGIAPDARLTFIKQRENAVFRVDDGERAYALRVHRHGHRSLEEMTCEGRQASAMRAAGVPVSQFVEPIAGGDGTIDDHDGNRHLVDVQQWVSGSEPFGDTVEAWRGEPGPPVDRFRALGEVLGRLHVASRDTGRIAGFTRDSWDADGLAGPAPTWGDATRLAHSDADRDVLARAIASVRAELESLGRDDDVFGVIHADTTAENVLVDSDELTLIDFDDFGEGYWLFDLATMLFWYSRHPSYADYRAALLEGYAVHVEVPARALAALDTLILARGTTYLGWAADRPGDETSEFIEAELLPVIVELARARVGAGPGSEATSGSGADLVARRGATIGPYSPLFYDTPLHFVRGDGVWLTDVHGDRYLDAYNNVPSVGHANPRVAEAVAAQLSTLNVHTRYLS